MAISVSRVIEQIVDWTHEEILALEAHLGIHPNRKPSIAAAVEIAPGASGMPVQTVVAEPAPVSESAAEQQPQGQASTAEVETHG